MKAKKEGSQPFFSIYNVPDPSYTVFDLTVIPFYK